MYKSLKHTLIAGTALAALATTAAAEQFNIPAGDLKTALDVYARQTGTQLLVSTDAVKGVRTSGVHGDMGADAALSHLLTGHGAPVTDHARLVEARLLDHHRRCERIVAILEERPRTAFAIAAHLWPARTVAEQPLLVVWEVVGHLELLLAGGHVAERSGDAGSVFELTDAGRHFPRAPQAIPGRRHARRRPTQARVRQR